MAYSYALVLTTWSPEKTFKPVKNKATKNDVRYVVSIQPELCSLAYGVLHDRHNGCIGYDIYMYRREVRSCSFRHYWAILRRLDGEASDGWASRLSRNIKHNTLIVRYTTKGILWIDTIKFPLFLFSQEAKFYSSVSIVGR